MTKPRAKLLVVCISTYFTFNVWAMELECSWFWQQKTRSNAQTLKIHYPPLPLTVALYQTMKDAHELLTKHNIEYWIDGGTMLGAVRHKGLIPWDDDLDIAMPNTQLKKFAAIIPEFKKLGYQVREVSFGYKILYPLPAISRSACLDVFIMVEKDNKTSYKPGIVWAMRDGKPMYLLHDELYPLVPYTFGLITVWGPQNPAVYLDYMYGMGWMNTAIQFNHHSHAKETVQLTEEDKKTSPTNWPIS